MSRQVISVCIFCFICATHSPCASHASVERANVRLGGAVYNDPGNPPLVDNLLGGLKERDSDLEPHRDGSPYDDNATTRKRKREAGESTDEFVQKIFQKFGDGNSMTIEGFNKLVQKLDLMPLISDGLDKHDDDSDVHRHEEKAENSTCSSNEALKQLIASNNATENGTIDGAAFVQSCPALVYSMLDESCRHRSTHRHTHLAEDHRHTPNKVNGMVWFYSILAVIVISACGLLALIIIPLMQKKFYKPLIQFLVALAVGTLAGDALLHLLPHAMSTGSEAEHHHHGPGGDENMWKGFVAMMGLTFFFVMERVILLIGKWRKSKQRKSAHSHVRVVNETCMDKYNSIPYCFQDIMQDTKNKFYDGDKTATTMVDLGSNSDGQSFKKSHSANIEKVEANQNLTQCTSGDAACTESNKMLPGAKHQDDHQDIMVILREHETSHHGHSHAHGHVHAAPQNFSAVAWMVIMGDGLHNFTDGMAIGAAFSGSLAGGFSTTVAVFCHELPHELGDFAMLLKAGMTIKQAVFYNLLSSVLCIFGNIFGVWLGNTEYASSWVFAAAAGMFLYIALVDMIPELSSAHEDESNITQAILHLSGLFVGVGIMTLIAFYEHDLKNIFRDPV